MKPNPSTNCGLSVLQSYFEFVTWSFDSLKRLHNLPKGKFRDSLIETIENQLKESIGPVPSVLNTETTASVPNRKTGTQIDDQCLSNVRHIIANYAYTSTSKDPFYQEISALFRKVE
jgi:hypothetical protein